MPDPTMKDILDAATQRKYTQADRELAQRIWKAPNALALSEEDRRRGLILNFIVWPYASNLCNDVAKGHGVVAE